MTDPAHLAQLAKAIDEARNGNRLLARLHFEQLAERKVSHPALWLWLAWVAESPQKAETYLLNLDGAGPYAELAAGGLAWLEALTDVELGLGRIEAFHSEAASPLVPPKTPLAQSPKPEFRVYCPECSATLFVRESALGQTRQCPACDTQFPIPLDSPSAELPPTQPPPTPRGYEPASDSAKPTRDHAGHDGASREVDRPRAADPRDADPRDSERRAPNAAGGPPSSIVSGGSGTKLVRGRDGKEITGPPGAPLILVVDDSPTVRAVLSRILAKEGYAVECAESGEKALYLLEKREVRLMLLDIRMRGIDGYEVCRRIRQNARHADLPVVMLSGRDAFFDRVQGRLAGCTDYITKPCEANVVSRKVREHVPLEPAERE